MASQSLSTASSVNLEGSRRGIITSAMAKVDSIFTKYDTDGNGTYLVVKPEAIDKSR